MKDILVERNRDFYEEYLVLKSKLPDFRSIKKQHIYDMAIKMKAPRFYIDLDTAITYIQFMKRGVFPPQLKSKTDSKRKQMCKDLYNTFLVCQKQYPTWYERDIVEKAILSPAPSFYIDTQVARLIINKGNCRKI